MIEDIKKLERERLDLTTERDRLISTITNRNKVEVGVLIRPINAKIKEVNIKLAEHRSYHKFKILWDCAKGYIPVSEKEKFYAMVDEILNNTNTYNKEL